MRILVEPAQLTVGDKAREARVPFLEPTLCAVRDTRQSLLRFLAAHEHLASGAKAVKRALDLQRRRAHDCEVVTDDVPVLDDSLPLEAPLASLPLELPCVVDVSPLEALEPPPPVLVAELEPVSVDCEALVVDNEPVVDPELLLAEPVELVACLATDEELVSEALAALRRSEAASAGSWPEAICT